MANVENIIIAFGFDKEQEAQLRDAISADYELYFYKDAFDGVIINSFCTIVNSDSLDKASMDELMLFYDDYEELMGDTVIWVGYAPLSDKLREQFIFANDFQALLLILNDAIGKAQRHFSALLMCVTPYGYLSDQETEEMLENDIYNIIYKKYGEKPDSDILKRFRHEWTALLEVKATKELAAVYELCLWLKQNNHPYRVSGYSLSGFIPYLLGITEVNPLQAHYHCPNCNYFERKYESNFGFDLRENSCPHCGTNMDRDGFDLIWQEYASYGRVPIYTVYLPDDLQPQIVSWANEHWLKKWRPEDWQIKQPVESQLSVGNFLFRFELNRNQISTNFHSRIVTAEDKVQLIQEGPHKELFEKVHFPLKVDLEEYVALLCVKKQSCAVKELANIVLLNGIGILSLDFPCCREDIFYFLKAHDFEDKDAFRGMTSVRKGRGLPVITDEMRADADSWIAEYCGHIDWLPSRAEIISELFFNLKSRIEVE